MLGRLSGDQPQAAAFCLDRRVIQAATVVAYRQDERVADSRGFQRHAAGERFARRSAFVGGFDAVGNRIPHHMQQRLKRLILHRAVDAGLVTDQRHGDLPRLDARRVVRDTAQAVETTRVPARSARPEATPKVARRAGEGVVVIRQRRGRGFRGFHEDGQVFHLFRQLEQQKGEILTIRRPPIRRVGPDGFDEHTRFAEPVDGGRKPMPAGPRGRRELLERFGLGDPKPAPRDQFGNLIHQLIDFFRRHTQRPFTRRRFGRIRSRGATVHGTGVHTDRRRGRGLRLVTAQQAQRPDAAGSHRRAAARPSR